MRAGQQARQGELGGRADGKEGVGHVLEPGAGGVGEGVGSADDDPARLDLRRERDLGKAAQHEYRRLRLARPGGGPRPGGVIEEHLVAEDGDPVLAREAPEQRAVARADERAHGVRRIHADDRARARSGRKRGGVDRPSVALGPETVGPQPHAFERRDHLEQRIGGLGHQHLVARGAQQLEDPGVALAGAGAHEDARGVDLDAAPGVVAGHRRTGGGHAPRIRILPGETFARQRRRDLRRRPGEAGVRGIRVGQIEQRKPRGPPPVPGGGQGVGPFGESRAVAEHGVEQSRPRDAAQRGLRRRRPAHLCR